MTQAEASDRDDTTGQKNLTWSTCAEMPCPASYSLTMACCSVLSRMSRAMAACCAVDTRQNAPTPGLRQRPPAWARPPRCARQGGPGTPGRARTARAACLRCMRTRSRSAACAASAPRTTAARPPSGPARPGWLDQRSLAPPGGPGCDTPPRGRRCLRVRLGAATLGAAARPAGADWLQAGVAVVVAAVIAVVVGSAPLSGLAAVHRKAGGRRWGAAGAHERSFCGARRPGPLQQLLDNNFTRRIVNLNLSMLDL